MKIFKFLYIFLILLFYNIGFSQSVYVPLSHPVYEYLNRCENRGFLDKFLSGTKPFTRKECASALLQIVKHFSKFTEYDFENIRFLSTEFENDFSSEEVKLILKLIKGEKRNSIAKYLPDIFYKNDRNLLSFKSDKVTVLIDPVFNRDYKNTDTDTLNGKKNVSKLAGGFRLRGNFGKNVGFFADYRNTKEWGLKYPVKVNYSLERLGFVNGYGTHIYHDETIAYLVTGFPLFEIEIGKNINRWGPGYSGSLTLSDYAASYDLIKFKTKFWRLKYTSFTGFLRTYPQITYESKTEQDGKEIVRQMQSKKYIAAHRLEIAVTDNLDIGLNEVVIYGDRGLEIAYLNPIMFFRSAEHYLGDMDNATMSADFNWIIVKGIRLYGEFFLDDVTIKKIGSDWYGNKFAYLGGIFITDPFKMRDTEFLLEYVRVKPFVYTHHYPINVYTHFSTPLGYFSGPNTENYFLRFTKYFSRRSKLYVEYENKKHGTNYPNQNIGGDINFAHMPGDPYNVKFLDGIIEREKRLGFKIVYDIFRHYNFTISYDYVKFDNIKMEGSRGSANLNQFYLGFGINY